MGFLDPGQATDTGADIAADAGGLFFREGVAHGKAGVGHRINGGSQAQMNEAIHVARFFLRDVLGDVETFDLACKVAGQGTGIECGNCGNAGFSGKQIGPGVRHRVAHGADTTQACHNDAATAHALKPFLEGHRRQSLPVHRNYVRQPGRSSADRPQMVGRA